MEHERRVCITSETFVFETLNFLFFLAKTRKGVQFQKILIQISIKIIWIHSHITHQSFLTQNIRLFNRKWSKFPKKLSSLVCLYNIIIIVLVIEIICKMKCSYMLCLREKNTNKIIKYIFSINDFYCSRNKRKIDWKMWNKQVKIFSQMNFLLKFSIQIGEDHIDTK